ncbi:MAG: histidine kinase [Flavobacteriaceae bacterium]|nr:histidine kinase [Flavobacteriaceae bacterium]
MNIIDLNRTKFIPLHLSLWVGVWFFFVYFFSYNTSDTTFVIWFSSFLLPVTMATTYFTVYYLIPKYLLVKHYVRFVLYSFYTLVFSTYFIMLTIFGSFIFLSELKIANVPPMSRNFVFVLILVYLVVGLVSFISILNRNFATLSKNKELENKILEGQLQLKGQELNYLKKQIHPHFLFNTLNTIYGFALRQSNQTPDIILKLSNLLDYILYQVQKPKVLLTEELSHIEEYLDLERIRFQDTLEVNFNKEGIRDAVAIPPMLLIPFVENAFKHGSIISGKLRIDIKANFEEHNFLFSVSNTFRDTHELTANKGIGLENIRKRLNLLYNDAYDLQISKEEDQFKVQLRITNLKL